MNSRRGMNVVVLHGNKVYCLCGRCDVLNCVILIGATRKIISTKNFDTYSEGNLKICNGALVVKLFGVGDLAG